ncbi:MAG: IrmA family protein, partial [Pseudomonadota bacterium]|nr:IrmA family protein [Pseudomonadota bacterium]
MQAKFATGLVLAAVAWLLSASPVPAQRRPFLGIYDTFSYWLNQGSCSHQFILDGNGGYPREGYNRLVIHMLAEDKSGTKLGEADIRLTQPFGDSEATRYATASVE